VLTGQNNRYRSSTNVNATQVANVNASTFGFAYFYTLTSTPPSGFTNSNANIEPVTAQPLYITNVTTSITSPTTCNSPNSCNLLIVASANDYIYAFDTANGNIIWSLNLLNVSGHCGASPAVFIDNQLGLPGGTNLLYYGVVATPAIDAYYSPTYNPTLFVTSACVTSTQTTSPQWYLDTVDLTTGQSVATPLLISDSTFDSKAQLSRASLLVSHYTGSSNTAYIHIPFGAGVREIGAESGNPANQWQYSGALFAVSYSYSTPGFTILNSGNAFYTECMASSSSNNCPTSQYQVFPSPVYTGLDGNGYGQYGAGGGPAAPGTQTNPPTNCYVKSNGASTCTPGGNWGVNGGGLWMSAYGAAAVASGDVFAASGNGAFGCGFTGSGQTRCSTPPSLLYFGESMLQFPPAYPASFGVASGSVNVSSISLITPPPPNGAQCTMTFSGGGATTNGTAVVTFPLPGSGTAPLVITANGSGYTSNPGSASVPQQQYCNQSTATVTTTISSLIPQDFYAEHDLTYPSALDSHQATYQAQELSRLDLDMGVGGPVIIPHAITGCTGTCSPLEPFIMTSDKVSNLVVMPTPEASGGSLGMFRPNESGLTGGTYTTQKPFQLSQLPSSTSGTSVCETVTDSSGNWGRVSGSCDEVHELAWFSTTANAGSGTNTIFYDLLTFWPIGEPVQVLKSNAFQTPFKSYSFNTTPAFNPCTPPFTSCTPSTTNKDPAFPVSTASASAVPLAVAVDSPLVKLLYGW
jgi:hypothetical protein